MIKLSPINQKIFWLTVFSIAMGFMETAVVVYLRKHYYPGGFQFPLIPIDQDIALIEFLREGATVTMLFSVAMLTGKTTSQKFAFFLYCFAIWDIFYYIFLKVLINWPASLLDWDILFLIPVPWVGPVIAPMVLSGTMIILMLSIIYFYEKGKNAAVQLKEWVLLIIGSVIVNVSFVLDYFKYVYEGGTTRHIWTLGSNEALFSEVHNYVPGEYHWWIFFVGWLTIVSGMGIYILRVKKG